MTAAFSTERLLAEPLGLAHAEELAVLHADPRVMATMGGETATAAESLAWIERNLRHGEEPGLGIFVFRERGSGGFVGRGALRRIVIGGAEEIEVGFALVPERWGEGLATEMALALAAHAEDAGFEGLVAYTEPTNDASRRVLEKAGFHYERDVEHHGRPQMLYRRSAR
ncbi:MAG TPA: GNAT family N-acetyltransferase [Gaiellaceae bacterium]|nr:GNAT family N-acetyltransferase [Gaiellaceae bacterium]